MKFLRWIRKKLTYFDVLIISVVLVLALGFWLFFYRKSEYVNIRVKVTDQNVLYAWSSPQNWYANRFQVGDSERDTLGRVITEVVGVETFNVDGLKKAVYLDLGVRAVYDTKTKLYSARGKKLVFGTPVRFDLSGVTFEGIVTEFPNSDFQDNLIIKETLIEVVARGIKIEEEYIEPKVLEKIKVGDKIVNSNGTVLAEVMTVRLTPAIRVVADNRGSLYLRYDPFYKDATISLKIKTKMFGNEAYVFDDLPLKVGEEIPLTFDKVFIDTTIVDIE